MKVVLFCHSLLSDWNHGNAHFLRGVSSELVRRGHEVVAYEPEDAWSFRNLLREGREAAREALRGFRETYPSLRSLRYGPGGPDLERALDGADLVLVHEWSAPGLVRRIGEHRRRTSGYRLLFHDTHHRSVSDPEGLGRFDLESYDGVLAFGEAVREIHDRRGWGRRAWTWHEAADVRVFRPAGGAGPREGDVVWIGNWGDEERTAELGELLVAPVAELGLRARIHGVRYPVDARRELAAAGLDYRGWLPNHRVPEVFARFRATVHIPRRPYVDRLPGVPTIRPFEALACGIPLVSALWRDREGLFSPGEDFLEARDPGEMARHLWALREDASLRRALSTRGRRTILERHTCAHRVDELLEIYYGELEPEREREPTRRAPGRRAEAGAALRG